MKKFAVIFAVAVAFLLPGCQKESVSSSPSGSIVFTAEIGSLYKTTLDDVRVNWETGDEIDIVSGSGIVTYVATPSPSDARVAGFAKKNPGDPEPIPLPSSFGLGSYVAVYPSGIVSLSEGKPVVTIPSVQHYNAPGSLGDINVMSASSSGYAFSFRNDSGLLAIEIKGDKMLKGILVGTKENNISGPFDLATSSVIPDSDPAHRYVELDCGDGVALTSDGVTFLVGIPSVTVARGELNITAVATDGTSASITNVGAPAEIRRGHISPFSWTPVFVGSPVTGDDWLETFRAGNDLAVGGKTYNISTSPSYASVRLSRIASGSKFVSDYLSGQYDVVFLDYIPAADEGRDILKMGDTDLTVADGVAIIGRYSSHQSELVFEGGTMLPSGSLSIRNVCVRTDTWVLQTSAMTKNDCRFDIEDCSFYITPQNGAQGGLISDNCTSAGEISQALGYLTLKNSVVVRHNDYNHPMFTFLVGALGTLPYKDFVIENNAFIYESRNVGREVCTKNLFYLSSDSDVKNSTLNFTFRNNSVAGYKGSGLVLTSCDPKSIVFEKNVIEAKLSSRIILLNLLYPYSKLNASSSYISGNYFNNSGSFISGVDFLNGDALKAKFSTGAQSNVATGVSPFTMLDTSIGYLGIDSSVIQDAGCSYETKRWRKWATDNTGGTEPYAPGHGSGDFGWQ